MNTSSSGSPSSSEVASDPIDFAKLEKLLLRIVNVGGPEPRLDGELDALVRHENEAWPPPYTANPMYLQQITTRLGLEVSEVSSRALVIMAMKPGRGPALLYAEALLRALIELARVKS